MLVVGSQGIGALGRLLLGSVSTALIQHAHCPVAVIRSDEGTLPDPNAPVLVGIDGSPASEAATALAFDEASRRKVDLVALHAWSDVGVFPILGMDWRERESEGEEVLGERLAGRQQEYPDVHVQRMLVCDKPVPLAARAVRARSAGGGRQPRSRRISRDAARFGEFCDSPSASIPVIVMRSG